MLYWFMIDCGSLFWNLVRCVDGLVIALTTFKNWLCKVFNSNYSWQTRIWHTSAKVCQYLPSSNKINQRNGNHKPANDNLPKRIAKRGTPKLRGGGVTPHGVFNKSSTQLCLSTFVNKYRKSIYYRLYSVPLAEFRHVSQIHSVTYRSVPYRSVSFLLQNSLPFAEIIPYSNLIPYR